jgi:predicted tellurium resistance membrane protein TerC
LPNRPAPIPRRNHPVSAGENSGEAPQGRRGRGEREPQIKVPWGFSWVEPGFKPLFGKGLQFHELLEDHGEAPGPQAGAARRSFAAILGQIIVIDLVFSLDSIITAVGMVRDIPVMIAAVVASVGLMMVAAGPIGRFVSRHPTVKMLALSFLIMIGMALVADGLDFHVPKGYIYFAMAFSVAVEMLNLRLRRKPR